ncbi:hypothetical protein Efla_005409 [Eimeria flavescens]
MRSEAEKVEDGGPPIAPPPFNATLRAFAAARVAAAARSFSDSEAAAAETAAGGGALQLADKRVWWRPHLSSSCSSSCSSSSRAFLDPRRGGPFGSHEVGSFGGPPPPLLSGGSCTDGGSSSAAEEGGRLRVRRSRRQQQQSEGSGSRKLGRQKQRRWLHQQLLFAALRRLTFCAGDPLTEQGDTWLDNRRPSCWQQLHADPLALDLFVKRRDAAAGQTAAAAAGAAAPQPDSLLDRRRHCMQLMTSQQRKQQQEQQQRQQQWRGRAAQRAVSADTVRLAGRAGGAAAADFSGLSRDDDPPFPQTRQAAAPAAAPAAGAAEAATEGAAEGAAAGAAEGAGAAEAARAGAAAAGAGGGGEGGVASLLARELEKQRLLLLQLDGTELALLPSVQRLKSARSAFKPLRQVREDALALFCLTAAFEAPLREAFPFLAVGDARMQQLLLQQHAIAVERRPPPSEGSSSSSYSSSSSSSSSSSNGAGVRLSCMRLVHGPGGRKAAALPAANLSADEQQLLACIERLQQQQQHHHQQQQQQQKQEEQQRAAAAAGGEGGGSESAGRRVEEQEAPCWLLLWGLSAFERKVAHALVALTTDLHSFSLALPDGHANTQQQQQQQQQLRAANSRRRGRGRREETKALVVCRKPHAKGNALPPVSLAVLLCRCMHAGARQNKSLCAAAAFSLAARPARPLIFVFCFSKALKIRQQKKEVAPTCGRLAACAAGSCAYTPEAPGSAMYARLPVQRLRPLVITQLDKSGCWQQPSPSSLKVSGKTQRGAEASVVLRSNEALKEKADGMRRAVVFAGGWAIRQVIGGVGTNASWLFDLRDKHIRKTDVRHTCSVRVHRAF